VVDLVGAIKTGAGVLVMGATATGALVVGGGGTGATTCCGAGNESAETVDGGYSLALSLSLKRTV
jgi:hypothetical protein